MTIGIYSFEIYLPGARSLKEKRQVLRRLKDRLRARYNLAVAELDGHADLWQRAALIVVSVAPDRNRLAQLFETVHREIAAHLPGEIIETGTEFLDGADGGPRGWSGFEP